MENSGTTNALTPYVAGLAAKVMLVFLLVGLFRGLQSDGWTVVSVCGIVFVLATVHAMHHWRGLQIAFHERKIVVTFGGTRSARKLVVPFSEIEQVERARIGPFRRPFAEVNRKALPQFLIVATCKSGVKLVVYVSQEEKKRTAVFEQLQQSLSSRR